METGFGKCPQATLGAASCIHHKYLLPFSDKNFSQSILEYIIVSNMGRLKQNMKYIISHVDKDIRDHNFLTYIICCQK